MQRKALVTGANGMLADALCPLLREEDYAILPTDIVLTPKILRLDIKNLEDVFDFVKKHRPDIIFHLAAETDVDKCELNKEYAFETNSIGTKNIAVICKDFNIPLVYISTGAVFDGEKLDGYTELDKPNPLNIYGRSKLEGEEYVRSLLSKYYIFRAGWMIGGYNKDKKFVWKIAELLKTKKEISVVIDKTGSPTFTNDFSKGIIKVVSMARYGLYHCVNKGICTRFDIAEKIMEYLNVTNVILKPITSDAFPLPAPRGRSEALINYNLSKMGIDNMRPWQDCLKEYLQEIA